MNTKEKAYELLKEWKGDSYIFGLGVLDRCGVAIAQFWKKALVVCNNTYMKPVSDQIVERNGCIR